MKHFRYEKRQVAYDDDNQRFHGANMMREPRQETTEESEYDSNSRSTEDINYEGSDTGEDVHDLEVVASDLVESTK